MAKALRIDFWNVGQGDCSVITLPDDSLLIIDVGPKESPLVSWMQDYRQASRRLHAVVITHNDSDHAGALPSLLALGRSDFGTLHMLQDRPAGDAVFDRLFGKALAEEKAGRLKIVRLEVGASPIWKDDAVQAEICVVHPGFTKAVQMPSPNAMSGIIQLQVAGVPLAIWPADTKIRTIKEVANTRNVSVLVGPHHGAPQDWDESQKQTLLRDFTPQRVYVSVGRKYGHPTRSYLDELSKQNCRVVCSQITTHCDARAKRDDWHVLPGNSLIDLPEPSSLGASCRGGMRLILRNGTLVPDRWDADHRDLVKGLRRPRCLKT